MFNFVVSMELTGVGPALPGGRTHYSDVIMGAIAPQTTSLTIVYSTVYSEADKKPIKAPRHLPLCWQFTGDRWIPRLKGK